MIIGYARVSTTEQNLDLQHDALKRAGCEKTIEDTVSGGKGKSVSSIGGTVDSSPRPGRSSGPPRRRHANSTDDA